jgi:PAS domain S-box-containing protein
MGQDIIDFFKRLMDSSDWPPRWHCGKWTEFHGWLYIVSDLLIWSAYFSIPLIIIRYISRRKEIRFIPLYFLFAAFILACGTTHLVDAMAFWVPAYRLNALIRLITGVLSWITVFYLVKLLPVAFSLKSSGELEREIEQRKKAEQLSRESERQVQTLLDEIRKLNTDLEHRVAERTRELYESQQLVQAIVDNSAAVIYAKDLQGRYLLVNQLYCELFHHSQEEVLGKTDYDIFEREAADAFRDMDRRVAHVNRTLKEEETARLDDGIHTYISVKSTLKDAAGQPNGIFGISTDITELKAVEENLRKSLREVSDYKFALDESAIVAITDQKGGITHVNDNFCKISKFSREELIGQDHRIINSGYHPKAVIRDLWVTISHGKIWRGELKNRAKDGTYYWVDTTIVPFLNDAGKPYQYVAIRADITHRKQVEEEFHQLNEELEDRVNLRTVQLESARKEMEAFAYSVSHDLRAPLRAVLGFTATLEEEYGDKLDIEGRRITSIIKNSTLKMGQLIDDLLAFSRAGKQEIVRTTVDTGKMVGEIIEELVPADGTHRIEWTVHPLPKAYGDIHTIRQVWVNLISNAIKYSGNREPAVIEIGHFKHEGQIAYFVKDNGVGFNNKYKDKLFRVFQRLHKAEEFEGTGVGLALVEKIVSKHGGRVWGEGEAGSGARFCFSLPESRYADNNIN